MAEKKCLLYNVIKHKKVCLLIIVVATLTRTSCSSSNCVKERYLMH